MKLDQLSSVRCRTRKFRVNRKKVQNVAQLVCQYMGVSHYSLGIEFVSSSTIKKLNKQFRGKDASTDVLSFPQIEFKPPLKVSSRVNQHAKKIINPIPLGDIVISLDDANRNAKLIGQTLDREVTFLIIHSVLHLCGHDHHKARQERVMIGEQKKLMRILNAKSKSLPIWKGMVKKAS